MVETALHSFFQLNHMKVESFSPVDSMHYIDLFFEKGLIEEKKEKKITRRQRKKNRAKAFFQCILQKNILKHLEISTDVHEIYENSVKKDDITDSIVQVCAFLKIE
jgi:hypothetical protein